MEQMMQAVKEALGNYNMLYLYLGCFVLAIIFMSGRRKLLLVPAALISIAVFTPKFYNFWNQLNDYAYWRTLWIVPIIPICAVAPAILVEKIKCEWLKPFVIIASLGVFCLCGSFIYKGPDRVFKRAHNPDKLPDDVCYVGSALLEMEEYPCVVADTSLSVYLRQYSGKIYMPYGRDAVYGSPSQLGKTMFTEVSDPNGDMNKLAKLMLNYGYDYLITADVSPVKQQAISDAGFVFVTQIEPYNIYKVTGTPTEIRTYNDKHLVSSVTFVDKDGNPVIGDKGYTTAVYEYDKYGRITYEFHMDTEGKGTPDASGRAGYRKKYDHLGNVLSETNLGVDGNPVIVGYASRKCEYNKKHKLIKESFFDEDGNPMLKTDSYYAVRTISYNEDKLVTGERFYDTDGNLIIAKSGCAGYDREIDKKNGVVTDRYIGLDGNYMTITEGYAAVKRTCDEKGNIIGDFYYDKDGKGTDEIYLDINGNEVLRRQGYSRVHKDYNEQGRVKTISYYAFDEPFVLGNGYASVEIGYDGRGNITNEVFLDSKDEINTCTSGYATVCREFNSDAKITREVYLNEEGNPCYVSSGYASLTREYNDAGDMVSEKYYDTFGTPIVVSNGYDEVKKEYNENHQLVKESYYSDGKLVSRTDVWYASFVRKYDDFGNLVEEKYFDTAGNNIVCSKGYATLAREYNKLKQITKEYYLDVNEDMMICSSGYAGFERKYDAVGNVIEETYLDVDSNPMMLVGGYSSIKREYNELYQLIKESYYDTEGKPAIISEGYASYEREFDDRNNVILIQYFDTEGKLALRAEGYAARKIEYNNRSQNIKELYYDTDMNRIEIKEGYSGIVREYTYAGDVKLEQYIDNKDKPIVREAGYVTVARVYDDSRRLLSESYYDKDDSFADLGNGYCVINKGYDEHGNLVSEICLDDKGELCIGKTGFAKHIKEYENRKLVSESYLDTDGNLINGSDGYAYVKYEYFPDGQLSLITYYNSDEKELEMGSAYLHKYLNSLKDKDVTVFIAIKDEGSVGLTLKLLDDLADLGIKTNLRGKTRNSYYAVIDGNDVIEDISVHEISYSGKAGDMDYSIASAAFLVGNYSSIIIDGEEYSKNVRGMNIVVLDNQTGEVIDSLGVDTYTSEMKVAR